MHQFKPVPKTHIMIKRIFFILSLISTFFSYGQWSNETIDSGFDPKYKASTTKINNGGYLKLTSKIVDEEKSIKEVKIYFDTIYNFNYSPEFPNGKTDTIINERREYQYEWKQITYINLSLIGGYHCEDRPKVEIVFVIGGLNVNYVVEGYTNSDRTEIELIRDVVGNSKFTEDFKKATKVKIRINENYCEDSYYEFNMNGSSSAISFVQI